MKAKMKLLMSTIFYRELRRILKDKDLILITLLVPVFYSLFYSGIYVNKVVTNIRVGIVDQDNSAISRMIKRDILADPVLEPVGYAKIDQAIDAMKSNSIEAYLIIPNDLEKNIKRGHQVTVPLYISSLNFMVNIEANKRLGTILQQLSYAVQAKYWMSKGLPLSVALKQIMPIKPDIHPVGNPTYSYGDFVVVGLLVLILQQLLMIGMAESTAKETEEDTWPDLFQNEKGSIFRIIAGKSAAFLVFFLVYFVVFIQIVMPLFHIKQIGSFWALLLFGILFLTVTVLMGFFLGTFFTRKIQAFQVLALTSLPIFLMSGYSWPFFVLPFEIKVLNFFIPAYWMMLPFQKITQTGAPLSTQFSSLLILIAQSIMYAGLLYWCLKQKSSKVQTI
ncbi:MAG: ABC transporter permease [Calditrichia bacterium]